MGEVARAGRRLRPLALRKVNPRTALVGALDPARPGTLASVGGYEAKLRAAGEGANVVVPIAPHEYGTREFHIEDLNQYRLALAEETDDV